LAEAPDGLRVRIHRSETDQEGQGRPLEAGRVAGVDLHPAGYNHDRQVADMVLRGPRAPSGVDPHHNTDPEAAAQQARRGL
jgi:hypothetical protein